MSGNLNLKILHLISSMDLSMGGPPQVCANIIDQQAINHRVALSSYSNATVCRSIVTANNIQNVFLGNPNLTERIFGSGSHSAINKAVEECDYLHAHNVWEPLLIYGSNAAIKLGRPFIITPHGMLDVWPMSQKRWKKRLALVLGRRRMLEKAKFIHVLNAEEEAGIRLLGIKNRCEIVPNGVTLEAIDPHLNPSAFYEAFPKIAGRPFVLFLGRLHFKKGLDILAKAAKEFFAAHPDWQFVVAGPDGGMEAVFKKQIQDLGLEKQTHLVGPIYGTLKYSLLSACEFFCLPSRQEGFSVAILEAMAASKPVVISEQCHFGEVANTESGFVTSLNANDVATALGHFAKSPSLRHEMGGNGRKLVEQKYTWTAVVELLMEKYLS